MTRPRFRWYAVAGDERLPRTRYMAARYFGWDVICAADDWYSGTGGATRAAVLREIDRHLLRAHGLVAVQGKVYAALED